MEYRRQLQGNPYQHAQLIFDKGVKAIKSFYIKAYWSNWTSTDQKLKNEPLNKQKLKMNINKHKHKKHKQKYKMNLDINLTLCKSRNQQRTTI